MTPSGLWCRRDMFCMCMLLAQLDRTRAETQPNSTALHSTNLKSSHVGSDHQVVSPAEYVSLATRG